MKPVTETTLSYLPSKNVPRTLPATIPEKANGNRIIGTYNCTVYIYLYVDILHLFIHYSFLIKDLAIHCKDARLVVV